MRRLYCPLNAPYKLYTVHNTGSRPYGAMRAQQAVYTRLDTHRVIRGTPANY